MYQTSVHVERFFIQDIYLSRELNLEFYRHSLERLNAINDSIKKKPEYYTLESSAINFYPFHKSHVAANLQSFLLHLRFSGILFGSMSFPCSKHFLWIQTP